MTGPRYDQLILAVLWLRGRQNGTNLTAEGCPEALTLRARNCDEIAPKPSMKLSRSRRYPIANQYSSYEMGSGNRVK